MAETDEGRDEELVDVPPAAGVAALRAERARCPDVGSLLDYAEQRAEPARREAIALHLAACATCADLVDLAERARAAPADVDDLAWRRTARRLDRRRQPWLPAAGRDTRRLGLAAAAVLALAVAGLAGRALWGPPGPVSPVSEVRGTALRIVSPEGDVAADAMAAFEWLSTVPVALVYRVEVEARGETLWQATTLESRLQPPPDLIARLAKSGEARWRVVGLGPSGTVVLESPWTPLRLRGRESAPAPAVENGGRGGQ